MADGVLLVVTDLIRSSIEELQDKSILDKIEQVDSVDVIEYRHVLHLFSELKEKAPAKYKYFHEFLEGSGIFEEPIKEPKKSPELLARLEKLKTEFEDKKYKAMVQNVAQEKRSFGHEFGAEVRTTSQQLTSVLNYVVTIFGCALFAYYGSKYAWDDLGLRILFSVVVGTIVALAELYFLARTEI